MSHNYHFISVTRTYQIYSLSSFQIYNRVWLIIVTMLYIRSPEILELEVVGGIGRCWVKRLPFEQACYDKKQLS